MTKIFVLRAKNELMGTYSSMEKAQDAIAEYLDYLQDDFDAFDELVACAEEPMRFTIDAIDLDQAPIETAEDSVKNIQRTIATVDYSDESHQTTVDYQTI